MSNEMEMFGQISKAYFGFRYVQGLGYDKIQMRLSISA